MSKHARLLQRGGRWTFRVWVPPEIRGIVGKREIWKSLGAVPHNEAVRLVRAESVKVDALFAAARQTLAGGATAATVTDADLQRLAQVYLHRLELGAHLVPLSETERAERRDAADEEAAALVNGGVEDAGLQRLALDLAKENALPVEGDTVTRLTEAVMRAMLEHLSRDVDRSELRPEQSRDPMFLGITKDGPAPARLVKVTFDTIIDAQVAKRGAGEGAKAMPAKSVEKYRRIARAFATFRKSDNAVTTTAAEVENWRDAMLAAGEPSNRTIADRLVSLGTIIQWGKSHKDHREAMKSAEKLAGIVEAPSYAEKPADETSYSMAEAATLLSATRRLAASTEKVSNKSSKRWLPWICLYAGLRIAEAEQLRRSDFFTAEGSWFIRVTTAGRRSLKTRSSERIIPVHSALEAEGLLDWVKLAPAGQLFSRSASSFMTRWVRSDEVGITREGISPNHGLRHLWKGMAMRYQVGDEAREYLLGHAAPDVHRRYGNTEAMLPGLAAEMRKIVALKVP